MTVQDCIDRYENEGTAVIINDGVVVGFEKEKQHPELWREQVLSSRNTKVFLCLFYQKETEVASGNKKNYG